MMQREELMSRLLLAILSCIVLSLSCGAFADPQYPTKPVRFIVPYGAGGAPDVLARIIAKELSMRLGEQFIVENQGGAGGNIGAAYVAKSAPDGYTLLFSSEAPLVINPHVYKTLGYDPVADFAPITQLVRTAFYVVVCPTLPVKTLAELAQYGRQHNLSYASTGFGTTMNLAGEMMKKALHFEMTHVPYKGVPPAMADIMACNVDVGFGAYSSAFPLIKSDKLSALAVSTETRLPETPDVPTLRESGLQNLEQVESSFSLLTPARTPRYIIELLHREVVELMNTDAMKKDLRSRGMTLITNKRPEEFAAWIAEYLKRYEVIVSDAKVVAQ